MGKGGRRSSLFVPRGFRVNPLGHLSREGGVKDSDLVTGDTTQHRECEGNGCRKRYTKTLGGCLSGEVEK